MCYAGRCTVKRSCDRARLDTLAFLLRTPPRLVRLELIRVSSFSPLPPAYRHAAISVRLKMTSQGPRNNLKEILRSRPHDVSLVVSRTKPSSSSGTQVRLCQECMLLYLPLHFIKGSKFKPANSTSNSQIGAVSVFPPFVLLATNLTRRVLNDILEFGSIGSGILPSRPQGSSEVPSSSIMRRVSSSSKKRPSPDPAIFADDVTPPKRTRVERVSEKENFFSGSMNHKGKEKAAPPIYITPGPARDQMLVDSVGTTSQDSASVSAISRSLPLDYSDLSMVSNRKPHVYDMV